MVSFMINYYYRINLMISQLQSRLRMNPSPDLQISSLLLCLFSPEVRTEFRRLEERLVLYRGAGGLIALFASCSERKKERGTDHQR